MGFRNAIRKAAGPMPGSPSGARPGARRVFPGLALLIAALSSAWGQCALHEVPATLPGGTTARLSLAWRETALAAAPGSLSEAEAAAAFALGNDWEWAWHWPFAMLSLPAGTAAGLGDPSWEINYRSRAGVLAWGASGLISFPLGDAGNGLGADAFGAAAFLSAAWAGNGWTAGGAAGMHGMLAAGAQGHGHAHAGGAVPLSRAYALAHPHAERELIYRLQWGRDSRWGFTMAVDGAHALSAAMGVPGSDFLEGEASLRFALAGASWKPSLRLPLSPDRRLLFGLGLAVARDW